MENIIKYALSTEKSLKLMESENKLIFVVDMYSTKDEIKETIEKMLKVKVMKVNTLITPNGQKRAIIKFSPESLAIDVATNLGIMQ